MVFSCWGLGHVVCGQIVKMFGGFCIEASIGFNFHKKTVPMIANKG